MDAALEDPGILAAQFRARVAGHPLQGLIHVQDSALEIRNHNAVTCRFQSRSEQAISLLQTVPADSFPNALGQVDEEV